jgi:glucose/arabinose dehydrogenase
MAFTAYQPNKISARRKIQNSDDHFDRFFAPYQNENQTTNQKKETTMNPLTHLKKTRILRIIFLSLGAIFALVTAAHAQNLYISTQIPGGSHVIYEYTPSGVQSTYTSGVTNPRGLAFDSIGNLFATTAHDAGPIEIGKVLKYNLRNHVSTFGSAAKFFFEGLAIDIAGNVYVLANDDTSPTGASTIFQFTPSGERIVFGSLPSQGWGLAFDSGGNLYAAQGPVNFGGDPTIYKFAPDGTRTVFAGPDKFATGEYPVGLAFDSDGNLFVSIETFGNPGADSIVYFTPTGVGSTFATGLTFPRGLAFDSSGNLFVAEANAIPDGDILKFPPGGGSPTVFASGFGRPEFLTFGPPR